MTEDVYGRYREALRLGHQYAAEGKFREALAEYRSAAAVAERALPHVGLGAMQLRLGQPRDALAAFERALELEPDNIDALSGRAAALLAAGKRAEAASIRDQIARLREGPRHDNGAPAGQSPLAGAEANAMAGEQARAAGNQDAAIDFWLVEAAEHLRAGHHDAALDACLRALAVDSGALRIHLQMIRVYFARGWDDRATQRITLLDRILTITPDEQLRAALGGLVQPSTDIEGQPVRA